VTATVIIAIASSFVAGLGLGCCVGLFVALQARSDEVRNPRKYTGNGH
jgi:hypothetical protein